MMDARICRICMCKDNLTSIWAKADGDKIAEKINFICGGNFVTASDPLPKFICHLCLSQMIIGASIKRKCLETEKVLNGLLDDSVEISEDNDDNAHDDPFYTEGRDSTKNKFLVYEENTEDEDQPKINFEITENTIRMKSAKNVENPELKSFIDGYLTARPNMEIIKVTDPANIKEIEKVIEANQELKRVRAKRSRNEITISSVRSMHRSPRELMKMKEMQDSRLLSALVNNLNRKSSELNKFRENDYLN